MVDPHVHLRDWNQSDKETIEHGLSVAFSCGFNEVFDMPNTNPPLITRDDLLDRLSTASTVIQSLKKNISYHVWAGLTAHKEQIESMANTVMELFPLVIGLKMFAGHSTGGMGIIKEQDQRLVFKTLADMKYTGVLAIHCEKEELMNPSAFKISDLSTQSIARPVVAEVESVRDMITYAKEAGFEGTVHICHISTKGALSLVTQARSEGMKITCGATAHHALLTEKDASSLSLARMNPPLRSEENRAAIFQGLLDGRIDWIESDHAPHTLKDKQQGAGGVPGFSGSLLLIQSLIAHGCSKERMCDLVGRNVYKTFGLNQEDVTFSVGNIKKIGLKSDSAAQAYPYDAFVSLRK